MELREGGDKGILLVFEFPDSETGIVFREIARNIIDYLDILVNIKGGDSKKYL